MCKTFSEFDKYALKPFADALTTYLQVESEWVDESFILSLNSKFGSGKSTFFEMWINELKMDNDKFKIVEINAWEADFQGDPLLAIVSSLMDILQEEDSEQIKETAGKLGKFALSIGNDIVQKVTGIDVIKAGEYAESKKDATATGLGHACFELYQEKQKLFENLKTLLRDFTEKSDFPILIIVDELDRCRPNYAIEFLETIKHFFDIHGLVFVIGVDKGQLASSAKALFGQELVFEEYYRKFAHRNVNLPVNSSSMTEQFCRSLVDEYLSLEAFEKKGQFAYAELDHSRKDNIVDICVAFSLNARQIHELFRIVAHVLSIAEEPKSRMRWGWQIGTFFMTALSINNIDLYEQIGNREILLPGCTTFLKESRFFNKVKGNAFTWAALIYMGTFGDQPLETLEKEFQDLDLWDPSDKQAGSFQRKLLGYVNGAFSSFGWDRDEALVFPEIYRELEGLKTFAS